MHSFVIPVKGKRRGKQRNLLGGVVASAVLSVADDGVLTACQLHADLMASARLQGNGK